MSQMTYSAELLEPEVRRQDAKIGRLRQRSPRTWPGAGEDLLAWRADTILQILEPGFQPLGVSRAPSPFIAVMTELCTEVRLGTSDSERTWRREPEDSDVQNGIRKVKAAVERAIESARALDAGSNMEAAIRDLYVMHMDARRELLEVMVDESLPVGERLRQVLLLRAAIRVKEIEKARDLPKILRANN